MSRVTSHDVARHAGVSQPTVSRVFSNHPAVSERMAERVRLAARELGYRPNTLARSLSTGRSRTIGLIVAYLDNPFYPEVLEKFSLALQAQGYHIMVFMSANHNQAGGDELDAMVENLLSHQVDGIVIASVAISTELTERLSRVGIPLVLFNRMQDDARLTSVTSNNFSGAREAARFLVAAGHKHIAHISGWQGSSTGRDRQAGFLAGLQEAGLEPLACIDCLWFREQAAQATRDLFAQDVKPDALFVGSDYMACAVMETIRCELGLRIPEDVSVIGYDDISLASWPTYELTTVRQCANQMVVATVALLLEMIEQPDTAPQHQQIDGPLIIRSSARIPEGWKR